MTGRLVHFNFPALLFLFLFTKNITAQVYPDPKVDSFLRTGINLIVEQKYADAESVFVKLNSNYPELPLGNIYLAAAEIARSYDFELEYDEDYILSNLKTAEKKSQTLLNKNGKEKWHIYFAALVQGYTAYYFALNGGWLNALDLGLSSVSAFEECLDLDPYFYESWIAIGTYEYWKSRKTEFLSWLPFISDNRKSGIEKLAQAVKSSGYNSHIAIHSLIWIYIDKEDFDSALTLAEYAVEKYPQSRIFKWALARAYEEKDVRQAIEGYYEVLESYQNTGVRTAVNEITLKHIIAQQYVKLNERDKAIELCSEILDYSDLSKFERDKLADRLKRVRTMYIELSPK